MKSFIKVARMALIFSICIMLLGIIRLIYGNPCGNPGSNPCGNPGEIAPASSKEPEKVDERILETFWGRNDKVSRIEIINTVRCAQLDASPAPAGSIQIPGQGLSLTVEKYGEYANLFRNSKGWIGGDGDYSVALSPGRTLWLFGDSFLGDVSDGKRMGSSKIVNNALAIQTGVDPRTAKLEFYSGRTDKNEFCALVAPADEKGWFWLYDGIRTRGGLYMFLIRAEMDKDSALGFKSAGMSLGNVQNSDEPPSAWKIRQKKLPFAKFSEDGERFLGSAVIEYDGWVYIYGIDEEKKNGFREKQLILARVRPGEIDKFQAWEFFDGRAWQSDFLKAGHLCGGLANELSVSYMKSLNKFVAIYSDNGASEKIKMRIAEKPEGPWGESITIYSCPEKDMFKDVLIYAAKAHPSISSRSDELVVSYITNTLRFDDLFSDARLYQPMFLRLRFSALK